MQTEALCGSIHDYFPAVLVFLSASKKMIGVRIKCWSSHFGAREYCCVL